MLYSLDLKLSARFYAHNEDIQAHSLGTRPMHKLDSPALPASERLPCSHSLTFRVSIDYRIALYVPLYIIYYILTCTFTVNWLTQCYNRDANSIGSVMNGLNGFVSLPAKTYSLIMPRTLTILYSLYCNSLSICVHCTMK